MPSAARPRFRFRAPVAIFWTAFLLRLAVILLGHTYRIRPDDHHFDFGFEAGRIAQSLVTGHGYGNPFNGPSGPTAWLGPLYPLLMAVAFHAFGVYSNGAAIALLSLNSLFSALIAPAVYEIAARCFDAYGFARRRSSLVAPVATWAAWLWAVYPAFLQYAVHWVWEMSLSTCLFTWALVVALRIRKVGEPTDEPRQSYVLWTLFGLLWAEICLSNPSLLSLFPVATIWILWPHLRHRELRAPLRFMLNGALLAVAAFGLFVSPWVLRNQRVMHAPILTRANFGVELWQSTHFYWQGFPWGGAMPLNPNDPEFHRYAQVGEVRYSAEKADEAHTRLAAHPQLFLRNTLFRIQFFWAGLPHAEDRHPFNEWVRMLNYSVLSVTGLLGLALMLHRKVIGGRLFAAVFLFVPLVYYAVTVQPRFRHPIEPLIAILTVYLFRSTDERVSQNPHMPARRAFLLAIPCGVLVLATALAQQTPKSQEASTMHHAHGTFTVKVGPPTPGPAEGLTRFSLDKELHGDIEGVGKGEMVGAGDYTKGTAGYVAVELITGTLAGKHGSFALQHSSTMNGPEMSMNILVSPGSGTGALKGIEGTFKITIQDGQHFYDLDYKLP